MTLEERGPFLVFAGGPTGKLYLPKAACAIAPIPGVIGSCMIHCGAVQVRVDNASSDQLAGLWTGGDIAPPPPRLVEG